MSAATQKAVKKYVVYYRVSTKKQGKSGLGLDAQQRDIGIFLTKFSPEPHEVIGTYTDIQSGSDTFRPQLAAAIAMAKANKAELLVSKLDRLSRKVSQIALLMEEKGLTFRVASMPEATAFQLHIYAALAQQEREFISARTVAALAEAKAKGATLGGLRPNTRIRNDESKDAANAFAEQASSIIRPMLAANASLNAIAKALNANKVPTARGKVWYAKSVSNVLARLA